MVRKFKFLGLALAAVFAMSAVGASAASATVEFHGEKAPVTLTGEQEGTSNAFDVQFGSVVCTAAKYKGRVTTTTATTVTITPTYEGCTFAGVATPIDMEGCDYMLHITNAGPPYKGLVDIECPGTAEITVTGGTKCVVHVPAQKNLGPITYTNVTNKGGDEEREITLDLDGITNITYSQTAGTGGVKCTTQEKSDGKYTGTVLVTGETDNGVTDTGIWIA